MAIMEFAALAAMCAPTIDPVTLAAVVQHESASNVYAIGINGDHTLDRQPRTIEEAIDTAQWLLDNGHNFDAGLGQINSANFGWLGLAVSDLFDPCKNLAAAETVLSDCYSRAVPEFGEGQDALKAALSCYNTGNFTRGFNNGYVEKVASNVGVTVPALEPSSGDASSSRPSQTPTRVQATTKSSRSRQTEEVASSREGIADVFGNPQGGAFAATEKTEADGEGP